MNRVGKTVPPKRQILKDISLSFFPGAKIGVLGLNGSGKSTLLKIMAGIDKEIEGEAIPMPGLKIGYLPQEPQLDPEHTVRQSVESGMGEVASAKQRLEEVYAAYAEEDADFDKLAAKQQRLEAILASGDADTLEQQLEIAADALRIPAWDAIVGSAVRRFRPISLTAATAVLAMIPLSRSVFWGPMAVAIMGGLVVATLLTMLFLPALYAAWFRVRRI